MTKYRVGTTSDALHGGDEVVDASSALEAARQFCTTASYAYEGDPLGDILWVAGGGQIEAYHVVMVRGRLTMVDDRPMTDRDVADLQRALVGRGQTAYCPYDICACLCDCGDPAEEGDLCSRCAAALDGDGEAGGPNPDSEEDIDA